MNHFDDISVVLNLEDLTYVSTSAKELLKDSDVKYYNATVSVSDINKWIKNYYSYELTNNSNQSPLTLTIAVDNDGYIRYLTNLANTYSDSKQGWEEKNASSLINRKIEIVLDKIGTTTVPCLEEMDLSKEKVEALETKWHSDRGCKREGDYYVCKNK